MRSGFLMYCIRVNINLLNCVILRTFPLLLCRVRMEKNVIIIETYQPSPVHRAYSETMYYITCYTYTYT